ncbi:MAG: gamma-glutamyltransferase [Armatimonadetes bacterium]|nr:gamma-glutamyltransferase [Armatimonadota bacterium]
MTDRQRQENAAMRRLLAELERVHPKLRGHSERVATLAVVIGAQLGLASDALRRLRLAAALHDVGFVRLPDAVLDLGEEHETSHTALGAEIVANDPLLAELAPTIEGVGSQDASVESRIIALAEAYDWATYYRRTEERQALVNLSAEGFYDEAALEALKARWPVVQPVRIEEEGVMASRSAVYAAKGVVASSQPLAAAAGVWALRQGGSCIDAAIACSAVLCVVEPWASQVGGDAFIVHYDAKSRRFRAVNASGAAPAKASLDLYPNGIPLRSLTAVTAPGLVDAWGHAHRQWGKLPFEKLFEPAIDYARNGYPISPRKAQAWAGTRTNRALAHLPQALLGQSSPPAAGDLVKMTDLARSLETIAKGGRDEFYRGSLADRIVDYCKKHGGWFEKSDLAAHSSEEHEPLRAHYHGHELVTQRPISQAFILAQALAILDSFDLTKMQTSERIHTMLEAIKLGFADRWAYLGDPKVRENHLEALLSPNYIAKRRAAIGPKATPIHAPGKLNDTHTTYFCAADADGNMVSWIQSVYHVFGSSIVPDGTGILLNNRLLGFSLKPDSPNVLAPGKRPMHTLNSYMVARNGQPVFVGGTPGADYQVQTNLQVIFQAVDMKLNPQAAIEAPRWAWEPRIATEPSEGNLLVEVPSEESAEWREVVEQLRARGHTVRTSRFPGHPSSVQLIEKKANCYVAGSDPRAEGMAVGY